MRHFFPLPSSIQQLALVVSFLFLLKSSHALRKVGHPKIKSAVFLSPKFVLGPGSVVNRYYYDIDFPRGHIALKSFNAEVVDEAGNSVPLHETYVHHWTIGRYYQRTGAMDPDHTNARQEFNQSDRIFLRNSGICQKNTLGQYYGLGSETRGTATHVPDPYGIEVGNPADIPTGYDERWMLNVHAIDTRGAEDRLGCIECRCDLYNITLDEYGRPLKPDYAGGLLCCYDHTRCRVKEGFEGAEKSLYLRYTVKWLEWDDSILPVKIYIFDVTDTWKRLENSTGENAEHKCHVEYEVESCNASCMADDGCIDNKRLSLTMPRGGFVVYGVAHQHAGGIGSALYGEDFVTLTSKGRILFTICSFSTSLFKFYSSSAFGWTSPKSLPPLMGSYDIDFPRGHIALKSFNAEVVDEAGNSVPLHETYLHHWKILSTYRKMRHFFPLPSAILQLALVVRWIQTTLMPGKICQKNKLGQYYGLGSETRGTATHVPDPYGIEVGNPADIPTGYDERWMLNVHAIDTRGAEDRLGCIECRCDLYNITLDEYGRPLKPDYAGGLLCCYDHTRCRVKEGFEGAEKSLYLRYTVKWLEWDDSILPVKIYIFDVTDNWKRLENSTGENAEHECHVEYEVESCNASCMVDNGCTDNKRLSLTMPRGGFVVYGVAHQHAGGIGSALYGEMYQDFVTLTRWTSYMFFDTNLWKGKKAGNEAGYIVGMSTCYPEPGSVKINNGEALILESNYSTQKHTGVMGLFYILVAEESPKPRVSFRNPFARQLIRYDHLERQNFLMDGLINYCSPGVGTSSMMFSCVLYR
ncbi:hypothetical protein CJ030_MR0G007710 [Morella rubra]|uniref:Stress up-regulated Nod 19 n=1 Tax=Morella rubra TaxID=262757 RepID=A0A6A1UJ70_9ROSI|nr:hypothetical protein CJ030_MR0G007710 [Morella rubra]